MSEREKFEAHVARLLSGGFPLSRDGTLLIVDICRWIAAEEQRREQEGQEALR